MWTASAQQIDRQVTKVILREDSRDLTFREVVAGWVEDGDFREFFTLAIQESPFEAFFWETPPVTEQTLGRTFESVLVESPALARLRADPAPFATHFRPEAAEQVVAFPNLGGDAILVVPTPVADEGCYPHLGRFLRTAPASQVDAFWRCVGQTMRDRISSARLWLSTAGMGVSWLHLRLDTRPKYYRYAPYQAEA